MGTIYKLQKIDKNKGALERGSSPENEADKKKHRQTDPRGWKLIHDAHPLDKAKEWLDALLPLMDGMREADAHNVKIVHTYVAHVKYLLYTQQYQTFGEVINTMKEKDAYFVGHPHFVYNLFVVMDELKDSEECKELTQLTKEYDADYLKQYLEQNTKDFDRMRCVLKCCLEIKGFSENIGSSAKEILEKIMKLECLPMQCVEIRNDLSFSQHTSELKLFEQFIHERFPLQLNTEK